MKLKLLSTLIAASFLAGCSSSGSNGGSTPPASQDGVADVQIVEGEYFSAAFIEGDEGNHQAGLIQGVDGNTIIRIDDSIFVTDGNEVKNTQGETVGYIQREGDAVIFHGNHGGEVVLTVENGRLIASEIKTPIDPDFGIPPVPVHPIELPPIENPIETDPDYGVAPTDVWFIGEDGSIKFNGEEVADARAVDVDPDGSGLYQLRVNDELIFVDVVNYGGYVSITSLDGSKTVDITITDGVIERIHWKAPEIDQPINTDPDYDNDRVIKNVEREEMKNGVVVTIEGFHGGELTVVTDKHGKVIWASANQDFKDNLKGALGIVDPSFGKPNFIGNLPSSELKEKVRNLSQEQRQQIKQAIKDRASRG